MEVVLIAALQQIQSNRKESTSTTSSSFRLTHSYCHSFLTVSAVSLVPSSWSGNRCCLPTEFLIAGNTGEAEKTYQNSFSREASIHMFFLFQDQCSVWLFLVGCACIRLLQSFLLFFHLYYLLPAEDFHRRNTFKSLSQSRFKPGFLIDKATWSDIAIAVSLGHLHGIKDCP